MAIFIHDIPSIEFFLILLMLLLGGVALQAFIHKRDLTQEDRKILFQSLSKGVIGLTILAAGLMMIALLSK